MTMAKLGHVSNVTTPQPPDPLLGMLNMRAVTEEDEIACDHVYLAPGAFAALAQRGRDAAHRVPLVAQACTCAPLPGGI
jgi:hypothetical protein